MAEIDQTIEELEQEVLAELEEANGANGKTDAPTEGSVPAEKMEKGKSNPEDAPMQDTGAAVVSPTQGDAPAKKTTGAAKEVSGQAMQKGEGQPDKMDTPNDGMKKVAKSLAAGDQIDHDGDELAEKQTKSEGMHDKKEMQHMDKKEMQHMNKEMMKKEMAKMTKQEMINAMYEMMKGEKKDALMAMYGGMKQEMDKMKKEGGHLPSEKNEAVEARIKSVDVSDHVDALMNGEGNLSEEFKRKAATVFEAAVKSKIRDEVERLEEEYKTELDESIEQTKAELSEKVDTYLNYVVEEWMKENELAIERGLKGEIAEDFISGLKTLFEDHYVDIPDEKYDVLEAQSEKITELEGKLNESIQQVVELRKDKGSLIREKVISEASEDLADTEIEKFKSLTEDVEFTDEESFREKLGTLKESYFPKSKPVETQTVDDVETGNAQDIDVTDSMDSYMRAIGKYGNSAK